MRRPVRFQPAFQNQHCGNLINNIFAIVDSSPYSIEMPVCFRRAEPLIPQMHGKSKFRSQYLGKLFDNLSTGAAVPRQMNGPTHNNCCAFVSTQKPSQRTQIVPLICVIDRHQRLSRQA